MPQVGAVWRKVTEGVRTCLGIAPVLFAGQGWLQVQWCKV